MRKAIVGVMGPGESATARDRDNAYQLGDLIAKKGWILLTGARKAGVMDAASQGAKAAGGLTVGILPTDNRQGCSEAVEIAIVTGMGNARNAINVLSSDVAIACGMGLGTASEVALALKSGKPVVLLTRHRESQAFFTSLAPDLVWLADNPEFAIEIIDRILEESVSREII